MAQSTATPPIETIVARNLAHFMAERGMKQAALAQASGVAQTTISLYLAPHRRLPSKSGKPPTPKVGELAQLAAALGIESWQLMRHMTNVEREFYEQIEAAFRSLMKGGKTGKNAANDSRPMFIDTDDYHGPERRRPII